ncbi:condensin complex protein MksE [Xanthomarina gelatinilytica]|uniref:condensin complex protein MksE n=1 Tax=Xanthomarina gelatinilytica TaxID=1137281 RepID=UPI003AA8892A
MYPNKHKQIVTSLMDGRFITIDESYFDIVKENQEFYVEFFNKSFGFELKNTQEFYYLISEETNENTSRDISIFFSIFCYELDKDGKNFMDELGFSDFHIDEIVDYIKNSSWTDIVKSNKQLNDADSIKRLVGSTMVKRNIAVKHSDDNYSFTKAYKLFIDFARDLVKLNYS